MSKEKQAPGIEPKHTFQAIDKPNFERILERYSSLVLSGDGEQLDAMRYKTIPDSIKARAKNPHLEKEELVTLVTWKLKHGTFRPALKSLVQQNDTKTIEETSRKGFAEFNDGNPKDAVKTLTSLKGIGPATASLMLSVYNPHKAPFFSDELFRWTFFESGKGNGWDRRIKYTAKEYAELYDKVQKLLSRLNVSAVDAEKVAYVLGKDDLIGARAREDLGKSSKRKREELKGSNAAHAGGEKATSKIGRNGDAAIETGREDAIETNEGGRPKRKSRRK